MTIHIALVPYQVAIPASTLTQVAAALQRQVVEQFAPIWHVDATVSAFVDWNSPPPDYVRLIVVDRLDSGSLGVHADRNHQPYALVAAQGDWPLVASHECLELLADPTGRQTASGPSPQGDHRIVEFLVEVCDPCQGERWSYKIDGIPVSDFCTPAFYAGSGAPGERWSYGGSLTAPRVVAKDGYIIWHDPVAGEWWRRDFLGATPADYGLGPMPPSVSFLRGHIDRLVRPQRAPRDPSPTPAAPPFTPVTSAAAKAKADASAREVEALIAAMRETAPAKRAGQAPTPMRAAKPAAMPTVARAAKPGATGARAGRAAQSAAKSAAPAGAAPRRARSAKLVTKGRT